MQSSKTWVHGVHHLSILSKTMARRNVELLRADELRVRRRPLLCWLGLWQRLTGMSLSLLRLLLFSGQLELSLQLRSWVALAKQACECREPLLLPCIWHSTSRGAVALRWSVLLWQRLLRLLRRRLLWMQTLELRGYWWHGEVLSGLCRLHLRGAVADMAILRVCT